ncbi:MAG TPA: HAD-IA family hydrolase [Actinomycetota bacterium]|nr:HAD-IA family hydrolase [Actinomycetota bacterium]
MRRYDIVLFDAGETLLRPEPSFPELIVALLRARGVSVSHDEPAWIDTALGSVFRAMDDLVVNREHFSTSAERSRAFWTEIYSRLLVELRVEDPDAAHAGYLYDEFSKPEHYALFPDALPALRELAAAEYTLGIVSNFEAWLNTLLERLGVMPLMSVVVVSGVEGIEKPDPKIFRLALDRIDVEPERAVYVGDNPRVDVEAALSLGMGAVLVDRRGVHDGFDAAPVVRSLEQVPAVIR